MSKLWDLNEKYDASKPPSWDNMPYKRLYKNLTPEELEELLRDAKRLRWEVLALSGCGLSALPDTLGELKDLRILELGSISCSTRYSGRNVFTKLPDSIGNLKSLQELRLDYTDISVLPDSIGNLQSLIALSLNKTQISALPDSVGNLKNLSFLCLNRSKIHALPDSIGNLKALQGLNLGGTQISSLPHSIENLPNLRELDLSETQISALPDFIGNLKMLRRLSLCKCHLKAIPYSVVALGLPFVMDNARTVEHCVNLTGVTLDEGDLRLFAQSRDVIEAHYREKARTVPQRKAVVTPSAPPVPKPTPQLRPVSKPTPEPAPQATPKPPSSASSELEQWKLKTEKLNALYLRLKIGLLISALVGLLIMAVKHPDKLPEIGSLIQGILGGG